VYRIMWQWRAVAWVGVVFWVVVSAWSWRDERRLNPVLGTIAIASILGATAIGSGSVTTNETGILKKTLWRKTSFQWPEITHVLLHRKRGLAVELRGGDKKLVVDSRFNGFQNLLKEIEDRTHLTITPPS